MNGFLSEHQAGNRRFTLYLPPSYSPNSRRFPAVYVQDGSSLFQDQIELLESTFQKRRLPELVLIGIESENRMDEYLLGQLHHSMIGSRTSVAWDMTICLT